jgi:hypothetical protein
MEDLFADIAYLAAGNERQQAAYRVLTALGLLEHLAPYNPILVGTVPLDIDTPNSDLDIICQAADIPAWVTEVSQILKGMNITFQVELGEKNAGAQATVSFTHEHFPIELYAESTPSKQQNGYRHMVVEYRILQLLGPTAALCIREWKQQGMKTEPAFARMLGLPGDPYLALLELCDWSDEQLLAWHHTHDYSC